MMAGGFSPAGLSVLIVDGDSSCLKNLETILKRYHYQVKTSTSAKEAAAMLKNERFEMVISDVNMSDINDGFLFIRHVAFNTKIPIIMMSNDGETNKVMRGLQCGACDYHHKPIKPKDVYHHKPIKPKDVQFIWQHVYRKRIYQIEGGKEGSRTTEIGMDGSIAGNKRGGESGGDSSSQIKPKKPRLIWTDELHQKFMKAVEIYGPNCPKKILELMGTNSVTREQVASHLQKHRINLARDAEIEPAANMNLQNQVANRINHYQGQQCVQNLQVQCESNDGYSSNQLEFRMPQPAHNYSAVLDGGFHAPPRMTGLPVVPEHIYPHTTMMRTNNEPPVLLPSRNIHNNENGGQNLQVANRINHYQRLSRHVQNPSNQLEFRMPQSTQDYSVLSDERFHAPPQLTGFPAVPQHINPHTTMMRTNNEQNVETGCYHQNQISSSSLPDAFGYSSDPNTNNVVTNPNTNTEEFSFSLDELFSLVYSPQHPNTFGGSDPNDGGSDPAHTYPKNDSDS